MSRTWVRKVPPRGKTPELRAEGCKSISKVKGMCGSAFGVCELGYCECVQMCISGLCVCVCTCGVWMCICLSRARVPISVRCTCTYLICVHSVFGVCMALVCICICS